MKRSAGAVSAEPAPAPFFFAASDAVPILYYDFENNTTRTTFENLVEQQVNSGSGALTLNTITGGAGVAGAGTFNGGAANGQAITATNWSASTTDPGTAAANYFQFVVNTTGFSGLSVTFDSQASSTGPARTGVLFSTDGSTFTATSTGLVTSATFTGNSQTFSLGAAADNQSSVTVRIYGFAGSAGDRATAPAHGAFSSAGTFRIDNLTVRANTVTASRTLLDYPAIGLGIRSGTAFTPTYGDFSVNGSGITVSLASTLDEGGTFTGSNGTLNCGTNTITGAGTFTLSSGATLGIGSAAGITSSGATGNIQTTTRNFNGGANYSYNGAVAQVTGNGLPATLTGALNVSNTAGVTLSQSTVLNGASSIGSGATLNTGAFTLTVGNTLTNSATLNVSSSGTIKGTGTVSGPVNVQSGGTVAPGSSPGILNTGNVTLTSGSIFAAEYAGTTVGTGYDQLNVSGTVTLGGATLTNTSIAFTPSPGNSFTIISNDSNDAVSGTFAGLIEGATIANFLGSGFDATISYAGGDGNDVVIAVNAVASDTDVVLSGGNLIVTDGNGGNTDDTLFLSLVSGNVRVTDPNHSLNCGAGMTTVNVNTCDVAFGSISGNIQVNTLGGNDQLTLELAGGDFIPSGGVSYAGGAQTTSDKLFITGGSQGLVSYNYTNANDGNIVMQNYGTVTYTGLEPISNSGSATDVVFNLPGSVANSATLSDLGGGMTRLASGGTFEQTDFANPSGSVTVVGGVLNDAINVGPLASGYSSLTVNGNEGNDTVDVVGSIIFATNANLDLNLQNDDPTPGIDTVFIDGQVTTSGTGTVDIRVSQDVIVNSSGGLQTQNGNLTIEANQQATLTTGENNGVEINGATVQSSGSGNISIKGKGGEGAFDVMYGVIVWNGGKVLSTGTGTITVEGTGGNRTSGAASNDSLFGVYVYLIGSQISSTSAAITITGNGGATNDTGSYGVVVAGGKVETSGPGLLTINGNGGTVTGGSGVFVDSAGIFVVADDVIGDGGVVRSTGTGANAGNIVMTGISGPAGTGAGQGLRVDTPGSVTTVDGSITLTGTGGACGNACLGTSIRGPVTATGAGAINITGTAAAATPATFPTHGVNVRSGGIVAVKDGTLSITGTGGNGTDNAGFNLAPAGTGQLRVSAGGTGSIAINADTIRINPTASATINALSTNSVSFAQKTNGVAINLGSTVDTTPSTLELSDGELDRVTAAGTINFGNANSGAITISNTISRASATNLNLTSNSDITFNGSLNAGGGNVVLTPGSSGSVKVPQPGVDVTTDISNATTLSFSPGADLSIAINGTSGDVNHDVLTVVGKLNLTGVDLVLSGGAFAVSPGQTFKIVDNDGNLDAITGTFNGLAEGATITNFLGSGYNANITYIGGDGNDVVLSIAAVCTPPSTVYVDDTWVGTTPGTDPDGAGPATNFGCDSFATIQDGINGVTAGGTVIVYAGTYAENVLVNKSVTLQGPNNGIDPNTGTRVGEAIVIPSVTATSVQASTSGTVFRVGSGSGHVDVTIDGFTIDGHNAALTNGRILNGVEIHTGAGIVNSTGSFDTTPNAFDTTMIVTNNIIQNLERYGVLVDNTPARNGVTGNDVSHNKIDNLPSGNNFGGGRGRGITFEDNVYGTVSYNVITRVNVGWQDDNYDKASPGAATLISHNTISAYHRGIFHNLQYSNASDATISDNVISVETNGDFGPSSTNMGIELASIQFGVGATVTNNNSTNNVYGILLWNLTTTADITITGGTLSGNQYGVYATSNHPQFGAAAATPSHSVINGITITNATAAGIRVEDTPSTASTALEVKGNTSITNCPTAISVAGAGASANVHDNVSSINDNTVGISVDGGSATINANNIYNNDTGLRFINGGTATAHFNRIISTTTAIDNPNNATPNLENNWWGCNAGPGNTGCGAVTGTGADFDPWIVLQVSATGTTPGGTSTVTADMTHNADNVVPAGVTTLPLPSVSFTATGGTIAPPTNTFTSGQSQATFTSTSTSNGSACATVDNQQTCATVTVTPPSFSIDDVTHVEGDAGTTTYTFTVSKTGATTFSSSVEFQTADDTATLADNDYQTNSGTLTFGPTDTTMQVTVLVNGDTRYEHNEQFFVNLLNPVDATISDSQGVGTITNDDAAPTVSINDLTTTEGTSPPAPKQFNFTITKSAALTGVTATVDYATADDTGGANPAISGLSCSGGVDYLTTSGTVTFPASGPGSTSQTVSIPVCRDNVVEPNETFLVNLSNPVDATINDGQAVGTITNDDFPPGFVVNTTADGNDGVCAAVGTGNGCTLREAILGANASPVPISISFAIPANDPRHFYYTDDGAGSPNGTVTLANVAVTTAANDAALPANRDPDWPHGWWSILPTSQLPTLTQNSLVDGYSQSEAAVNTASSGTNAVLKIEIEGSSAGTLPPVTGLNSTNVSAILRGLAVNRFSAHGLQANSNVNGNFLGTDVSGTLDLGNAGSGMSVGNNMILGGATPDLVNLISGNDTDGVLINSGNSNTIQGNLIGTKANGTAALPNTGNGITLVGGGSVFNTIGGANPGEGNTIAFNTGDGVQLSLAGVGNTIRGNSIFSNGSTNLNLGIDLGPDGVTPNDNQDSDPGPNNLQNFPIITSALKTGSTNTITGTLNSTPGQTFTIDFYANATCDAAGNGEGAIYLGSLLTGTTDGSGNVSFTFHPTTLSLGQAVTATATSATADTSEFSECATVTAGTAGAVQFVSATYSVNENAGPAQITFQRVGGTDGSISATFNTIAGGTADASDYTPTTQTVTFADGDTGIKTVSVPITDDPTFEGNETVNLCLGSTTINVVGCAGGSATLTIVDTDTLNISARDARVAEPTSGSNQMVFAVSLDSAPAIPVSVNYATADDTGGANPATSGATCNGTNDYQPTNGTLNFAAGERVKTVAVNICSDTVSPENDETLLLNLSGNTPAGTVLARAQAVGTITQANPGGAFVISELRTSGPGGLGDDFVELYNNTDTPLTVAASDATAGYGLFKMGADCNATPALIGTIPNGTVIPARGHYLFVGSQYSLANYGGTGAAAGNATLTQDVESDRNVAVFSTTDLNKLATVTRLDAVGFTGNTGGGVCDLLREGTTLPPVSGSTTEHSFFRKQCGFVPAVGCTTQGTPKDTNNNNDDLMFADTQGTFISGVPQRLGAPGPENLTTPLFRSATISVTLLDNTKAQSIAPNRVRDLTSNPGNNSTFGTIAVRRRVVNNTAANVTRLRFRIVEFTTFPSPDAATADLRALTIAGPVMVSAIMDPGTCGASPVPCTVAVQGTSLETPPAQPSGGGFNTTVAAGTVSTGTPLAPGQSINLNFLLGVQATGTFRFLIIVEALP